MIDAARLSLHAYGMLVVALYDGRLLCVAIAEQDKRSWRRPGVVRKRPVISWAGGE